MPKPSVPTFPLPGGRPVYFQFSSPYPPHTTQTPTPALRICPYQQQYPSCSDLCAWDQTYLGTAQGSTVNTNLQDTHWVKPKVDQTCFLVPPTADLLLLLTYLWTSHGTSHREPGGAGKGKYSGVRVCFLCLKCLQGSAPVASPNSLAVLRSTSAQGRSACLPSCPQLQAPDVHLSCEGI